MHPVSESVVNAGPNALRMDEAAAEKLPEPSARYSKTNVSGLATIEAMVADETAKVGLDEV